MHVHDAFAKRHAHARGMRRADRTQSESIMKDSLFEVMGDDPRHFAERGVCFC